MEAVLVLPPALIKKKDGTPDQCTRPKAEKLTFCQVEQDLGFDPRKIARDRNISCH